MATMKKEMKEKVIATFAEAKTYEELKVAYIDALKANKGAAAQKFIDAEFDKVVDKVKDVHVSMEGKMYKKTFEETTDDFKALVTFLLSLDGITIEQCGTWLWIGGENTKKFFAKKGGKYHDKMVKEFGCGFSNNKKMWFKKPADGGKKYYRKGKAWDMNKIRDTYGSIEIKSVEEIEEGAE